MKIGCCKLCLKEKELCRESHIIPDFHYKILYGLNNQLLYFGPTGKRLKYNSEYEANILCKNCETNIIGKLDDYAAKFLHDKFQTKTIFHSKQIDGKECFTVENNPNYDYARFKLFLLSMLWRASISSRPLFQAIKLSFPIEDHLRLMILKNMPGEPEEYPCFIYLPPLIPTSDGRRSFNTFYMPTMSPKCVNNDGFEACEFVIEGTHYYFVTSIPKKWNIIPGVEKNKLTIGLTSIQNQSKIINEILKMIKANKDATKKL